METGGFHIGSVLDPERGELETVCFLAAKFNWLDVCLNNKVVRWCGTPASVYYAQGIINELVGKASMGTASAIGVPAKKIWEAIAPRHIRLWELRHQTGA